MASDAKTIETNEAADLPLKRFLACPLCGSALVLSQGTVRCPDHGHFPSRGRLISFVSDEPSEFDRHWELAQVEQRPRAKLDVARRFLEPLRELAKKGRLPISVLDIGCGDGVHIQELQTSGAFAVVGLDSSARALASAMQVPGEWLPIHADAQRLPFASNCFDAVISFGVLAYLDDPDKGLAEAVRVARPGGLVGLWFAPQRPGIAGALLSLTRGIVPSLPSWLQITIANTLVPFLGLMPTSSTLSLKTGTWRQCREVILVNIATIRIVFPSRAEIEKKLGALGCEIVSRADAIEGEYWARKAAL